jgi:hypothetical protein
MDKSVPTRESAQEGFTPALIEIGVARGRAAGCRSESLPSRFGVSLAPEEDTEIDDWLSLALPSLLLPFLPSERVPTRGSSHPSCHCGAKSRDPSGLGAS